MQCTAILLIWTPHHIGVLLQHNIEGTLKVAEDILQLAPLQHEVEEVPDQQWLVAIKVHPP